MTSQHMDTQTSTSERLIGRVKWFNNKAGYGFITVTDGNRSGSDVFVHHSSIGVKNQQYKYLVQGEYVDFVLSTSEGGSHEYHAIDVSGIKGGQLMCETRHEFKVARSNYKTKSTTVDVVEIDQQPRQPKVSRQPKLTSNNDTSKEWSVVQNRRPDAVKKVRERSSKVTSQVN